MISLLAVLAAIAIIDSTSMLPVGIVAMVVLLSGNRPYLNSAAFIAGTFIPYYAFSLLALFGLSTVIDQINETVERMWKHPDTLDIILGIAIGVVLLVFGYHLSRARAKEQDSNAMASITPARVFIIAAGIMIVGLPGAVPMFAAIDQILRVDLDALSMALAMLFYSVVFVLPLIGIVLIRVILRERSDELFETISRFFEKWGRRVIVTLLVVLGLVLVVDGIGWFLGMPLIPV
jgi:cytochrome c biogenesis protein CcdA